MMKNLINKKFVAIASLLVVITMYAPRSLKHEPVTSAPVKIVPEQAEETPKPSLIKIDKPTTKAYKASSSMDWTVTTTEELTSSIQYIKQTLTPKSTDKMPEDKLGLLKSLDVKERQTKLKIKQASRKGDKAYSEATFSVNRLAMAVAWHKKALELLESKLSLLCAEKNMSYKDFRAMEETCKETLFYEVYAYTCSKYPDPAATISSNELEKIIDLVISQYNQSGQSQSSPILVAPEQLPDKHHRHSHSMEKAPAKLEINTAAPAPQTTSTSDNSGAKLWAEIKGLKAQQFEQSVSHKQNIQLLQKDLTLAQHSLASYKQTLEKAAKKTSELQHSVEQVSAEKLTKTIEIAKLEKRLEALEKTHKNETEKLNLQINKLSKDLEAKEKALAKFNEQKEKFEHKLQSLENALTQAKQHNLGAEIEAKAARNKQARAEEYLKAQQKAVEKKLAKFNEQMQNKEKEVMENRLKIKKLEKELKEKQIALMEKKMSLNSTNVPQTPLAATPGESAKSTFPEVKEPSSSPSLPLAPQPVTTPSFESLVTPNTPAPAPIATPTPEPKPMQLDPLLPKPIATTPTSSSTPVVSSQPSNTQSGNNPLLPPKPVEPAKPSQSLFINV